MSTSSTLLLLDSATFEINRRMHSTAGVAADESGFASTLFSLATYLDL